MRLPVGVQRMDLASSGAYGADVHEFSLCRAVAATVEQHADGRQVEVVRLRIGHFRQVVPDTMVHCWELQAAGTPLEGSQLEIESVPASIRCRDCGATTVLDVPVLRCGACDGVAADVISGEEFLIDSIDVTTDARTAERDAVS